MHQQIKSVTPRGQKKTNLLLFLGSNWRKHKKEIEHGRGRKRRGNNLALSSSWFVSLLYSRTQKHCRARPRRNCASTFHYFALFSHYFFFRFGSGYRWRMKQGCAWYSMDKFLKRATQQVITDLNTTRICCWRCRNGGTGEGTAYRTRRRILM